MDQLELDDPRFSRAIQFVTNNTLVAEKPKTARDLAYNLGSEKSYDAVSLDGTLFQTNGIMRCASWYNYYQFLPFIDR